MDVRNIYQLFSQLIQDPKSDIQTLRVIDGETALVIAELKPMKKLGAHYHMGGSEIYHVLSGQGEMELGALEGTGVLWSQKFPLKPGDVLEVTPFTVHRLSNTGVTPLKLVFFAPTSHLCDEDRYFI